jgi:hypothetical protein
VDEINRYRTTRNIEVPVVEKTTFHKPLPSLTNHPSTTSGGYSPSPDIKRYLKNNNFLAEQSLRVGSSLGDSSSTSIEKKLNLEDFYKKYESQRVRWEKVKNSPPVNRDQEVEERELESATFHPEINPRSKNLVRDLEKIEYRVKVLNEGRERKIKELQDAVHTQYSFKPSINKRSEELMKGKPSAIPSKSPMPMRVSVSPIYKNSPKAKNDKI